jgi:hypothetical protein
LGHPEDFASLIDRLTVLSAASSSSKQITGKASREVAGGAQTDRPQLHSLLDQLVAVGGAVVHFQWAIMMDVKQVAKAIRDAEMGAEIEDLLEGFNQPTWRGLRINGERVPVWSSRNGWSGL